MYEITFVAVENIEDSRNISLFLLLLLLLLPPPPLEKR